MASSISFGGLASGMDTNSIIDKLVEIEGASITKLQKRQTGVKSQVSTLGDLASKLATLETAAKDLATGGVVGFKTTGTNTAFSATPGSGATAGSYRIQVTELAQAAKARSAGFAAGELVAAGTLAFTVQGKAYSVKVGTPDPVTGDGPPVTLDAVAAALRASGAPISAVVLDDGTNRYLSVSSTATGHPLVGGPAAALAMATTQPAVNAQFTIDGLSYTRSSNDVSDALPGTSLSLKTKGGPAEDLVVANDTDATKARLQTFADAYNAVYKVIQGELQTTALTDRGRTLNGDSTLRFLQGRLQSLMSAIVPGTGTVRSLADVGLKTSSTNGSLSVDTKTLTSALDRDPASLNALFSTAGTGLQALTSKLTQAFTRSGDGVLTSRKASLEESVKRMDGEVERLQNRLEKYRETLVRRFTAMEDAVSKIRTSGNYLTTQWNALSKKE